MSAESIRILNRFFVYAEKIGLELLQQDKKYLRCLAISIAESRLRDGLRLYIENWQRGMRSESNETRKQGAGRRLANQTIREYLK